MPSALRSGDGGVVAEHVSRPANILWVGEADHWSSPRAPERPAFAMPLCEESVLETAFNHSFSGLRRLSKNAALACVSRYCQRRALERGAPDLNPGWAPITKWPKGRAVVKAPASCLASGVRILDEDFYVRELLLYAPKAAIGVVEEFVEGPQWELDGFVIGGEFRAFRHLLQHWSDGRIVHYEPSFAEGLENAVKRAIRAVGLDECPFCAEMRLSAEGWKVVELHARLGEDKDLAAAMWPTCPLNVIESFAGGKIP